MSEPKIDDFGAPEPVGGAPVGATPGDGFGAPEPVQDGGDNLGVIRAAAPPAPAQTDQAIVQELHARVDARAAGEETPERSPALQAFRTANADASLAAFRARTSGLSAADGTEALQRADASGLGSSFVAQNLPQVRAQDKAAQLKTTLVSAPVLASYAAQSPAHAAAVADDADNLGFLEWFFGQQAFVPDGGTDYFTGEPTGDTIETRRPALTQAMEKGYEGVKAQLIGLIRAHRASVEASRQHDAEILKRQAGENPDEHPVSRIAAGQLEQLQKKPAVVDEATKAASDILLRNTMERANREIPGTEGHLAREMAEGSVEAIPQIAPLLIPGAGTPVLFAQTYGNLHNRFSLQQRPDGSPAYTPEQVNDLALAGSTATATILGGIAGSFSKLALKPFTAAIGKLLPAEAKAAVGAAGADALAAELPRALVGFRQQLAARGLELGEGALHGLGFMVGQAVIEDLTSQAGDVMTGGEYDPSKTWLRAKDAARASVNLLPLVALGPGLGLTSDIGRSWRAQTDAVQVQAAIDVAKKSTFVKSAPDHAQDLVEQQAKSGSETRATAYIPVEAFDAAIAAAGADLEQVTAQLADQGAAYQEAKATGGDVAVPMSEVLTKLAPAGIAEHLVQDLKLDADGMTPREAAVFVDTMAKFSKAPGGDAAARLYAAAIARLADLSGKTPEEISSRARISIENQPPELVSEDVRLLQSGEVRRVLEELPESATLEDLRAAFEGPAAQASAEGPPSRASIRELLSRLPEDATAGDLRRAVEGSPEDAARLFQAAWHGSPHRFDEFSMQHIGSGEGAQIYGHGLYFAQNPEVAKFYREALTKGQEVPDILDKDGQPLSRDQVLEAYFKPGRLVQGYGGTDKVIAFHPSTETQGWTVDVQHVRSNGEPVPGIDGRVRQHYTTPNADVVSTTLEKEGYQVQRPGALYQVDVPESDRLLDYDNRLAAQPKDIQDAVIKALTSNGFKLKDRAEFVNGSTGGDVVRVLSQYVEPKEASEALRAAGIPGLQYLDQGSRQGGEGSHNFVIWDDREIKTLQRLQQSPVDGAPLTVGPGQERGSITIGPKTAAGRRFTIRFGEGADESTIAHEAWHALSVVVGDLASEKDATPEIQDLHERLAKELGYEDGAARAKALDPAKEEAGAAAFEQYLFEGKAPKPELAGVFAKFKDWLSRIYGQVRGGLTENMRAVLDDVFGGGQGEVTLQQSPAGGPPKGPQPDQLAEAARKAKEARDIDAAYAAYAAGRVAQLRLGDIKPFIYEQKARLAAAKMAELADKTSAPELAEELSKAQTQHLVNDHLARAAERAIEKATKIGDYFTERATDERRAQFAKAGPEFRDAFDAVMGALGLGPRSHASIDDAVKSIAANGGELAFDPAAATALIAKASSAPKRPFRSLTVDDAQELQTVFKSLARGARDALEVVVDGRRQSVAAVVQLAKDALAPILNAQQKPAELSPLVKNPENQSNALVRAARGANDFRKGVTAEGLQPQEIMRRLGLSDLYHHDFVDARNYEEELRAKVGNHFYEHYEKAMPAELKARRFEVIDGLSTGPHAGKVTRQTAWELASWMGSASSAERASKGLGVSEAEIFKVLDQLEKPEWDFVQSRFDFSDKEVWPLLSKYLEEKTGVAPPKIEARQITTKFGDYRGGYNPARYRFDLGRQDGQGVAAGVSDAWGNLRKGFESTANYFTKARAQKYFDVPDLDWQAFASHLQAVTHYLAFDPFVSNFGRILRNPEFRDVVRKGLGEASLEQLDEFHRTTARGGVEQAVTAASNWSKIYGTGGGLVRSRVGLAAFQLNIRVVAGQLSHLVAAMPALGISPLNMARGVVAALDPRTYDDAFANSRQLGYRWNEYGAKTREMLDGIGGRPRSEVRQWQDTAGWALYHVMDGFLSKSIWEAARLQKLAEINKRPAIERTIDGNTGKIFLTDEEKQEAYDHADRGISQIMPPRNIMEQSSFARDRGVLGSMMLVRNFPNTIFNITAAKAWDAQMQARLAAPGWARAKAYAGGGAAMAGSLLATYLAVHILGRYLMGHGKEEEETHAQWLTREGMMAPLYQFGPAEDAADPFIRSLVSGQSLKYELMHGHAGVQNAPALELFNQTIKDIGELADAPRSEDRAFAGLRLVSRWTGGPTPLLPNARYGYDLATGHEHPRGPLDLGSGLYYGKRPHQARNPLSDASKELFQE